MSATIITSPLAIVVMCGEVLLLAAIIFYLSSDVARGEDESPRWTRTTANAIIALGAASGFVGLANWIVGVFR